MSLKEISKELFTRYGLNDVEIRIFIAYLGLPQTTSSMISEYLGISYEEVKVATEKLVDIGFIKEIKSEVGVSRYIPLEPFFELYIKESTVFREEIEKVKDFVLDDQSKRFKQLEEIKNNSISEIETAIKRQVDEFFKISDVHNVDKKEVIEKAKGRFLTTLKSLENEMHGIIDGDYNELESDVKQMDSQTANMLDNSFEKLDETSNSHKESSKNLEISLHSTLDSLNGQLKTISEDFISKYENGIAEAKEGINNIIFDLLKDFTQRVNNLETEMKKDLDAHVDKHKENAQSLTPALEEILAKYMTRMNDVVEALKRTITKLLYEHIDHVLSTTKKIETRLIERFDERQGELIGSVKSFEDNTVVLIDNLIDISSKVGDLSKVLKSRGSAFKALFTGSHKQWVELNKDVKERIAKISSSTKSDFVGSTSDYITNTTKTKDILKSEISAILSDENNNIKIQTDDLDRKTQSTVNAELEGLAGELSTEIDDTLKGNIGHCKDTTIKLKDSIGSNFSTHKDDYDAAINRHLKKSINHYEDSDSNAKNQINNWNNEIDQNHSKSKISVSDEISGQISDVTNHSSGFEENKNGAKQRNSDIFNERLTKINDDFNRGKKVTSEKITSEIDLVTKENNEINEKLQLMLEDHKLKYNGNSTALQESMSKTISDNNQSVKDSIADFTLQFMNHIDEADELALSNEEKLADIFTASSNTVEPHKATTWHVVGLEAIIEYMNDALNRVKSSVIVVSHEVIPKILESMSQMAYKKRSVRFFYTTHWAPEYMGILEKMKSLGNIQFRQMKQRGEFIAMTRDAEEVLLAPISKTDEDMIAVVSTQEGYTKLYSQFIGPVFMSNSRPI